MANKHHQIQHFLPRDFFSEKLSGIKYLKKIPIFIYRLSYNLAWLIARAIFPFFLHFEVESKEKIKKLKPPLIVAANHSSWLDPFLIGAAFPFASEIFPIRYACWHKHYYSPRNYIFVHLFGAFPIKKRIGLEKSLEIPLEILKNKGVIGIFPEGRRAKKGRHRRGRRGAAYLAIKTRTKILPVKIEGSKDMKFDRFLQRHYKAKVKIDKAFYLPLQKITKPEDLNKATNLVMKRIREL